MMGMEVDDADENDEDAKEREESEIEGGALLFFSVCLIRNSIRIVYTHSHTHTPKTDGKAIITSTSQPALVQDRRMKKRGWGKDETNKQMKPSAGLNVCVCGSQGGRRRWETELTCLLYLSRTLFLHLLARFGYTLTTTQEIFDQHTLTHK